MRLEITLSLPRKSAEKVLALLDAERTTGAVVIPVKEVFTTTEAATMLGRSRPTLMKLIEAGEIDHVKVDTSMPTQSSASNEHDRHAATRPRRRSRSSPARSVWVD